MLRRVRLSLLAAMVLAVGMGSSTGLAQPIGSIFTFQGELRTSGNPVSAASDLQFKLFDSLLAGSQIGPTLTAAALTPSAGRFTVDLDFGAGAFGPSARYVELAVRSPAGTGSYITLSPRQRVNTTPASQFSLEAATATSAATAQNSSQFNGQPATFYQNASNLNSGTIPSGLLSGVYSGSITFSNVSNVYSGSGTGLTGVNADRVDGLHASSFLQAVPSPLSLSGSDPSSIIRGQNASTVVGSAGVSGVSTSQTGATWGVYGQGDSDSGAGVYGKATRAAGVNTGVYGESVSWQGRGVYGWSHPAVSVSTTYGVYGQADAAAGIGVYGTALSTTGATHGVFGKTSSGSGNGVRGINASSTGEAHGVHGESESQNGIGVYGFASDTAGTTYGGYFQSDSTGGRGLFSLANSATGTTYGVYGQSNSTAGTGVYGYATAGGSVFTYGVQGRATSVYGYGVYGTSSGSSGRGVSGSVGSGTTYGVWGSAPAGTPFAVYASGNMGASGAKPFRIDHPDDPTNRYLLHYAAESPEIINFYRGMVVLDGAGGATVDLPPYFAKINKSPSYQLTPVGAPMPMLYVSAEIDERALITGASAEPGDPSTPCWFRIAGGVAGAKVSWEVKAVRNDRWVQQNGAAVELDKQGPEKGTYQHPELYGKPASMGMSWPALERAQLEPAPRRTQP